MIIPNNIEAIIILANEMNKKGILNLESRLRVKKAIEIFKKQNNCKLVTCGWDYLKGSKLKIAEATSNHLMNDYLISKDDILLENKSRDTVGEAIFTRKDLIDKIIQNLAIITSPYHIKRSKEIFNFVYGESFNLYFGSNFKCSELKKLKEENSLLSLGKLLKVLKKVKLKTYLIDY